MPAETVETAETAVLVEMAAVAEHALAFYVQPQVVMVVKAETAVKVETEERVSREPTVWLTK